MKITRETPAMHAATLSLQPATYILKSFRQLGLIFQILRVSNILPDCSSLKVDNEIVTSCNVWPTVHADCDVATRCNVCNVYQYFMQSVSLLLSNKQKCL